MWDAHLKLKFIGKWWKISLLCNVVKVLTQEQVFAEALWLKMPEVE